MLECLGAADTTDVSVTDFPLDLLDTHVGLMASALWYWKWSEGFLWGLTHVKEREVLPLLLLLLPNPSTHPKEEKD